MTATTRLCDKKLAFCASTDHMATLDRNGAVHLVRNLTTKLKAELEATCPECAACPSAKIGCAEHFNTHDYERKYVVSASCGHGSFCVRDRPHDAWLNPFDPFDSWEDPARPADLPETASDAW